MTGVSSTGSAVGLLAVRAQSHAGPMQTESDISLKHRPLLITEDPDLIDDVLHLAAAAGTEVFVAPTSTRGQWAASPLVLVGADALGGLVRMPLERRRDVVVILPEDGAVDASRLPTGSPEPWRDAVAIGAEHVIVLPEAARWLGDRLGAVAEGPCRHGVVIGVAGAVGGSGASTLACALALAARRSGRSVLLVDHDAYGGGLDLVLGSESLPGARWQDVTGAAGQGSATGRISAASLDAAVPHPHGVALLSHSRRSAVRPDGEVVSEILQAGVRGYDLVVVDLPGPGLASEVDLAHLFTLVPNRIRGIAAAAISLPGLGASAGAVHLVLRRSSRGIAPRDAERSLAATFLGEVPDDPKVPVAAESGDCLPDAMVRTAAALLERAGALPSRPAAEDQPLRRPGAAAA